MCREDLLFFVFVVELSVRGLVVEGQEVARRELVQAGCTLQGLASKLID